MVLETEKVASTGDLYLNSIGFMDGPPAEMRKLAFERRKRGGLG